MKIRLICAAAVLALWNVGSAGSALLQPGVKEYTACEGVADFSNASVIFQDQEQCRIAADEILSSGLKRVYAHEALPDRAVLIAVKDSTLGKRLVREYSLAVPKREQGYALRVKGARAAIVGFDAVGALYGAVTFRQLMAERGLVESVAIRDWPDIAYRGGMSIGRGLWKWSVGKDEDERIEELKKGIDELLRHKLNGIEDVTLGWSPTHSVRVFREAFAYARARGIRTLINGSTCLWTNRNCPEGMRPDKWSCVTGVRAYGDKYYCWADDDAIEASANRCIDMVERFQLEDPIVQIHPVDSCLVSDPEEWSKRCEKCRRRWKDGERWKASANLFNIWRKAFDRRLPKASFISPVVPYWISWLQRPEAKRNAVWRQNVTDYWRKLDGALIDGKMAFESWIADRPAFAEYRQLLPLRPVCYTDTYPISPGLFQTCRRKIGTMFEPGGNITYRMTGTDTYGSWESCLLGAEYAWNVNAPGSEPYDGVTFWHPVQDAVGPEVVMTNVLPRICRTFWGKELSPYMVRVMSSGVLPKYLENPLSSVRTWNKVLKNALYDPEQARLQAVGKKGVAKIVDSVDFRRRQLRAAEICASALSEAREHAASLSGFKLRYFNWLVSSAPRWRDRARQLVALGEMDALLESGETEKLLPIVDKALSDIGTDDIRREFSRLSVVLKARSCDAAVPSAGASVGKSVPSGGSWRKAEVWKGERIIDRPVVLNRRNIKILPGSRLVFKDNGRLDVRQGQFRADGVTFAGEGVLTNAWRISVSGGKIEILNSRFHRLFTHNPGGARWFHGGVYLSSPSIRVAGCRFENTQSLAIVNSSDAVVCDSAFSCIDEGAYFLNSAHPRVERNVFDGKNGGKKGIELGGCIHAEIVHNRFDRLALGVYARTGSSYGILCGNAFDGCKRRLSAVESKGTAVISE